MTQEIFIIGTGRSGTHYLTEVVNSFKNIYDPFGGAENRIDLRLTRAQAIRNRKNLSPVSIAMHKSFSMIARIKGMKYVNQSHPNLFFYEHLSRVFPKAKFVAVLRSEVQVVSSMIMHTGVTKEILRSNAHSFPNQFLGDIDQETYEKFTDVQKYTLRVVTHFNEIRKISDRKNVLLIRYEDFDQSYCQTYSNIANFLDVSTFDHQLGPVFNAASLDKWKGTISAREKIEIEGIVREWSLNK